MLASWSRGGPGETLRPARRARREDVSYLTFCGRLVR